MAPGCVLCTIQHCIFFSLFFLGPFFPSSSSTEAINIGEEGGEERKSLNSGNQGQEEEEEEEEEEEVEQEADMIYLAPAPKKRENIIFFFYTQQKQEIRYFNATLSRTKSKKKRDFF